MKTLKLIFGTLMLVASSFSLFAQNDAVSLCGNIDVIEGKLAKKLSFFTEYSDFQQAMVFNSTDNEYMMEIIYKLEDRLLVDRKPMTQADLDRLCVDIIATGERIDAAYKDQSGRTEFLVSSTISGLAFYGPAALQSLDFNSDRANVGTYMLVGSGSFFVPFLMTKDGEVTKSMARAYSIGTLSGIGHGFILKELIDANDNDIPIDWDRRERRIAIPMALGLVESIGLMKLAQHRNMTVGNVAMIGSGSAWGAGLGGALSKMIISENKGSIGEKNRILPSIMIGSVGGMFAGHTLFNKMPTMTNGDVIVTNAYGLMGTFYAATMSELAFDSWGTKEEKVMLGGMTLLSASGLAYGLHRTKDYNYTTAEGSFIGLSQLAGGMLGVGVGYLISGDDMESETALVSASLGATAGLFVMDNFLRKRNMNIHTSIGNINIDFNPSGVANAFDKSEKSYEDLKRDTERNHIVSARVVF